MAIMANTVVHASQTSRNAAASVVSSCSSDARSARQQSKRGCGGHFGAYCTQRARTLKIKINSRRLFLSSKFDPICS